MTTFALDTALEAISVVFLFGAILYGYRLSRLTRSAEIVALARPKTFFASIIISFASLFAMQVVSILNSLFVSFPYVETVTKSLIITTALSGVYGLYTAVYYYRTTPKRAIPALE